MDGPSLENAMIRLPPPPSLPQIATDGFAAEKKRLKEIECITCAGSVAVQRLQELEVDIGCTAEEMQV